MCAPRRPSHPASNVRDDREAPLLEEAGRGDHTTDLRFWKSEMFFDLRLDSDFGKSACRANHLQAAPLYEMGYSMILSARATRSAGKVTP
jgi:hypothetical protein